MSAPGVNGSNPSLEAFANLIAIGQVSLTANPTDALDASAGGHIEAAASQLNWHRRHQDGRLVDKIAEASASAAPVANQQVQLSKLDYIIEFLRQNKLTGFCDLLTSAREPVKSLLNQLDQMKQFTLFVPTNEALELMPASQLAAIQSQPEEARQFLMAHATGELVVPKLAAATTAATKSANQQLLLSQLASRYSPSGAQNRWSSGRPLERLVQQDDQTLASYKSGGDDSDRTIYSLAGSPLRIITTPVASPTGGNGVVGSSLANGETLNATRLELIVNGANVLSGHSHALQEPNNTQITYAIVHLLDRPLYPVARQSLYDRIRTSGQRFAKFLQLAQDQQLIDQLKLTAPRAPLLTAFVPSDDSFRLLKTNLLEQLETNRTFLQHFVRSHFVEGLFFSGQLSGGRTSPGATSNGTGVANLSRPSPPAPSIPRQLTSLAGVELEFETKALQSRQVILVNSVPLLEHDQMALNGVLHSITRPIFERNLLDVACNCEGKLLASDSSSPAASATASSNAIAEDELMLIKKFEDDQRRRAANQLGNNLVETQADNPASRPALASNWFRDAPTLEQPSQQANSQRAASSNANELEREESQAVGQSSFPVAQAAAANQRQPTPISNGNSKIIRAQRSDNSLIARNNRDFYRPSTAPVNLLLLTDSDQPALGRRLDSNNNNSTTSSSPMAIVLGGQPGAQHSANIQQQDAGAGWTTNGQRQPASLAANLAGQQQQQQQDAASAIFVTPSPFEVERYKVVLNATSRQRLREQQGLIMSSSLNNNSNNNNRSRDSQNARIVEQPLGGTNQFVYDQPLSTQRTPTRTSANSDQLSYAPATELDFPLSANRRQGGRPEVVNQTGALGNSQVADAISSSSSTQRQQRLLLKFQAEDARDQPNYVAPFSSTSSNFTINHDVVGQAQQRLGALQQQQQQQQQFQQPQDSFQASKQQQQQRFGKTVAPPQGVPAFNGCAFYDADCKRLVGRLVRLPANLPPSNGGQLKTAPGQLQQPHQQQRGQNLTAISQPGGGASSPIFVPAVRVQQPQVAGGNSLAITPTSSAFDSTFGETTENPLVYAASGAARYTSTPMTPPLANNRTQHHQQIVHNQAGSLNHRPAISTQFVSTGFMGPLPARVSPLNQPLPPWSEEEEHKRAHGQLMFGSSQSQSGNQLSGAAGGVGGQHTWRAHEMDLARIQQLSSDRLAASVQSSNFSSNLNSNQQVLMVPVKMLQDSNISLPSSRLRINHNNNQTAAAPPPIYFAPAQAQPTSANQPQPQQPYQNSNQLSFASNTQYFTPTIQPNSQQYFVNQPSQLQPQLGRLTNFTALEMPLAVEIPALGNSDAIQASQQQQQSNGVKQLAASQPLKSPLVQHRLRAQQQLVGANQHQQQPQQQQVNQQLQEAIKQARKIVRLQTSAAGANLKQPASSDEFDYSPNSQRGDISITSAKLSAARPPAAAQRAPGSASGANFTLATQASNQSPDLVSGLLISRPSSNAQSAPLLASATTDGSAPTSAGQSADFFQNRTIAEIMDDSGLRIDGQQVTFNRLHECLERADLFNLVSQPGSALTIFMPTDAAFQRLVQQQALLQQRTSRSTASGGSGSASLSARLTDPARKHLIPLIARAPPSNSQGRRQVGESGNGFTETSNRLTSAAAAGSSGSLDSSTSTTSNSDSPLFDLSSSASSTTLAGRLTLDCSTQQARQLLLDHLSGQLITPRQLQSDLVLSSLSGKRLLLSSVPSKKIVVVDGQPVIAATRAKNGMVYVVNKFLNISQQQPNVIDLLDSQPNLKTFQSYLSFASLSDRLKRETGPITILAPTNEAFEQLSSAARQLINSDPSAMMDILRGHIIEGAQFGKLISMRSRLKTMNSDHFLEAKVIKPNIYQLDNQMTSMKLIGTAGNGVLNSIDRLIVPPWLRVATGTGRQSPSNTIGQSSPQPQLAPRNPVDALDNVGRLETNRQPATSTLNLPLLNNQPIKFEQPDARLSPTNSFALAGTSSTTTTPNSQDNNNLLDNSFGDISPSSSMSPFDDRAGSASFGNGESPASRFSSSRVAADNSTGATPAGGRLTFAGGPSSPASNFLDTSNSQNLRSSTGNVSLSTMSKNMQLIEKLAGLMRAKRFVKYLLRSRLSSTLKPDMNYVILIPTDQAMERLPKQILDMLERDPDRLSDLVNFHVLDTTFEYINTIPDGQTLNTLNEKDILFNWHRNNTILTASGAVVLGGIQEENIALLVVDRVLYPTPGNLLSIVTKSPILSNFTNLIRNAGLEAQLSLTGPFTLFAPSDFAFNQLDKRDFEFLQKNRDTARRFLLRHLSQPAIFTSSIALSNSTESTLSNHNKNQRVQPATSSLLSPPVPMMTITNSLGEDLTLRQKNDYFSVNEVNFSYADVAATNGVVHVIDGLL